MIQVMRPVVAVWSAYMKHQVIVAAKKVAKVGAQWQV
jgi:hypothetical protein